jgi:purine-nucleoside/S-methyl-5'-thioadenosine phosphorylase / adenosine deaminase
VKLFRWSPPGPYEVAFSTRLGGVSDAPFKSLNLGKLTRDRAEHVVENRRRLCREVAADPERLALNLQRHSAIVNRAQAGSRGVPGDGLWTDESGLPMLKLCADCVPVAVARTDGGHPALALLHAGWRGLLEGVVAAGVAALNGRTVAVVGPSIGPCCYEVGPEVAEPFAERFGGDVLHGRKLDLWTSAERALREAGCDAVERLDLCTACNPGLFFSYRRDGLTGVQGVIGYVA